MADHRYLDTSEVHEPKHISDTTVADSGKVITPSSGGESELRQLALADLVDGGDTVSIEGAVSNGILNYQGWELVEDGLITAPTVTVTDADSRLTIDDEGEPNKTTLDYLPLAIRDTGNLWDRASSKVTPIFEGDTYQVSVSLKIDSVTGTPSKLIGKLDIGGLAAPSNVLSKVTLDITEIDSYTVVMDFPIYCLAAFKANGGQFFLKTDQGTATVSERSVFISRTSTGLNGVV